MALLVGVPTATSYEYLPMINQQNRKAISRVETCRNHPFWATFWTIPTSLLPLTTQRWPLRKTSHQCGTTFRLFLATSDTLDIFFWNIEACDKGKCRKLDMNQLGNASPQLWQWKSVGPFFFYIISSPFHGFFHGIFHHFTTRLGPQGTAKIISHQGIFLQCSVSQLPLQGIHLGPGCHRSAMRSAIFYPLVN